MRDANGVTYLHADHLGSTSVTSGANTGTQVYFPFGGIRAGSVATDYTFTGQKLDASDGLMYYGARYYDAALGRFISADTIVPSAGNPQSLNRYSYVYNNPLKYNDPNGHCPNPGITADDDGGSVLCVDLFIATQFVLPDDWRSCLGFCKGLGDNRGFSWSSSKDQSRAYLYIYLDEDGNVKRVGTPQVNKSCLENLGCSGSANDRNSFTATQDPDTLVITVEWHLWNGVSGKNLQYADEASKLGIEMSKRGIPGGGDVAMSALLPELIGSQIPSIDGTIQLGLGPDGLFHVVGGSRDPYPSLEVYRYTKNDVQNIWQSPEKYGPNVGPIYGLSDQSPRDTYGR